MKVPLPIPCPKCGVRDTVKVDVPENWWEWTCRNCSQANSVLRHVNFTQGRIILEKARHEYIVEEDYDTSVIFSAMAFDCELARLYFKWTKIDERSIENPVIDEQGLEERYRNLGRSVADKIDAVAKLLMPEGIDAFVESDAELSEAIGKCPSLRVGSLCSDLQRALFWPRNRIVHHGATYDREAAIKCFNLAIFGLDVLKRMDLARRVAGHRGSDT